MILFLTISFFVFGLIIGSFLNVVIHRFNTSKSLGGRSACMSCRNKLGFYELIPIVSFIMLKGRCRNCKTRISMVYPMVEFATGFIFASIFLRFQDIFFISISIFAITYAYFAIMFSILVVITVYDLRHKIIPDILSFIFGTLAFVGLFFFTGDSFYSHIPGIAEFLSGIFIALPFAILWFVSAGRWMGLGDAKLALGLGWMLGLFRALSAVGLAFFSGAIIGLFLIVISANYDMKSEIPFAIYLVIGTLLVFLFGIELFAVRF
jgi:leader peptidase (prepilin peptidase) / N-methyltransferase